MPAVAGWAMQGVLVVVYIAVGFMLSRFIGPVEVYSHQAHGLAAGPQPQHCPSPSAPPPPLPELVKAAPAAPAVAAPVADAEFTRYVTNAHNVAPEKGWFIDRRYWQAHTSQPPPIFIVSMAHIGDGGFRDTRDWEYWHGLRELASHGFDMYGVVSEDTTPWPMVEAFPGFKHINYFGGTNRGTKSSKEGVTLQAITRDIANRPEGEPDPETWIFKASGRYQIVRDDLLREALNTPDADIVGRVDENRHLYTFWFGLKWKHWKAFHLDPELPDKLEHKMVETALAEYMDAGEPKKNVYIDLLYVVAWVNNEGPRHTATRLY